MRRLLGVIVLAGVVGGCGRTPPSLSGGKPVNHWVESLQSPDAGQRKTAVAKLGNVGPSDPAVLPALLGALNDPEAAVRREAIVALMKYGPGAREAIPTLTVLQERDRDSQVRDYAARAVEKLRDLP